MALYPDFKEGLTKALYLIQHDDDKTCVQMAENQWNMLNLSTTPQVLLFTDISYSLDVLFHR